jgi:hypothetical protein
MRSQIVALPLLLLVAACTTARVGTRPAGEFLDRDSEIDGFATFDGIRPYDGDVVTLGIFGSQRPGEWLSLGVWPLFDLGVGPIGGSAVGRRTRRRSSRRNGRPPGEGADRGPRHPPGESRRVPGPPALRRGRVPARRIRRRWRRVARVRLTGLLAVLRRKPRRAASGTAVAVARSAPARRDAPRAPARRHRNARLTATATPPARAAQARAPCNPHVRRHGGQEPSHSVRLSELRSNAARQRTACSAPPRLAPTPYPTRRLGAVFHPRGTR